MTCPKCGGTKSVVVESRKIEGSHARQRVCSDCGRSYRTIEVPYDGALRAPRPERRVAKSPATKPNSVSTDLFSIWK